MRCKKNSRKTHGNLRNSSRHNNNNNKTTFRSSNIPNERITATKYTNAD